MLIYSNYNFLDVKLELQIRSSDGTLTEKPMQGTFSPPGLRFPNGGVIDTNFVVSGTYLTSSKQEYALWALDLRTLTWSRIDAGGNVFSQGSWNRGVLWSRRNTFVILGNRKRSLVEDYNHRRINFSNVCMVELEAFGLYDNPRKAAPMSGFVSASAPFTAPSLSLGVKAGWVAGGRALSRAAEELGSSALGLKELADMDILCVGGERIPVNSRIIARRWGPYFIQLLREGAATQGGNDSSTVRPDAMYRHNPSRNSSVTITPSLGASSGVSSSSTLNNSSQGTNSHKSIDPATLSLPPDSTTLSPTSRPRTLYLPHTHLTLQSLLHFLYTSSLPASTSPLCTPQILCSLLQLARPYKIDGLLEAVVERLHGVLDSRNAAAVFNASAMAAGGGRSTSSSSAFGENWLSNEFSDIPGGTNGPPVLQLGQLGGDGRGQQPLRINTAVDGLGTGAGSRRVDDEDALSATSSAASDVSGSDISASIATSDTDARNDANGKEIWKGDISAVIGLQKRGLRGLMEGRRLRERGGSVPGPRVGLGIGGNNWSFYISTTKKEIIKLDVWEQQGSRLRRHNLTEQREQLHGLMWIMKLRHLKRKVIVGFDITPFITHLVAFMPFSRILYHAYCVYSDTNHPLLVLNTSIAKLRIGQEYFLLYFSSFLDGARNAFTLELSGWKGWITDGWWFTVVLLHI
jgi:hypothetical protein